MSIATVQTDTANVGNVRIAVIQSLAFRRRRRRAAILRQLSQQNRASVLFQTGINSQQYSQFQPRA
ncbi:hypothetical protein [Roseovarius aestuarii]|uniref:hypothetical protein n=1 Tax=Roseovarius aestuarii TaxID=475083 RepID=UPI00111C0743|nr:hypothetical protein [Roseovarius aestuarii]